jgi:hypothetical protein
VQHVECFFIAPIGRAGSPERDRSDGVLQYIVGPAVEPLGMRAVRADHIGQPGQITHQVIERVLSSKGAVADLTGANANVYYELAVRHAARLPVVLIADEDEQKRLPFDLSQMRTIFFSHTSLASAAKARDAITAQMTEALDGAVDSPVTTALTLKELEGGSRVEQTLADLVARVDRLTTTLERAQSAVTAAYPAALMTGNLGASYGGTGSYIIRQGTAESAVLGSPYFITPANVVSDAETGLEREPTEEPSNSEPSSDDEQP